MPAGGALAAKVLDDGQQQQVGAPTVLVELELPLGRRRRRGRRRRCHAHGDQGVALEANRQQLREQRGRTVREGVGQLMAREAGATAARPAARAMVNSENSRLLRELRGDSGAAELRMEISLQVRR